MIIVNNLTKIYRLNKKQMTKMKTKENKNCAAKNISFVAKVGEIYGLLGPNGAGKTTALRCIATLLKPSDGSISVFGYDTVKESEKVRELIGFLTNEIKLDPHFTTKYMFEYYGKLHGMDLESIDIRRVELFTYFKISEFENKMIDELSTGMRQKAAIAVSLVHDPKVVIFDEPTNGLDIVTSRDVTDYLKILKEQGKVVIISTHIMSEVEKLCDRIGIIIGGEMLLQGTMSEILEQTESTNLEDSFFELFKKYNRETE